MIPRLIIVLLIVALLYSFTSTQPAQPQIPSRQEGTVLYPTVQVFTRAGQPIDLQNLNKLSGDYYVRATSLLSEIDFSIIQTQLRPIFANVPGGLVFEGSPPYYIAFASHETIPLSYWPQNATHLLGITLDGKKGFVDENGNDGVSLSIDFNTGALVSYPTKDPRPSSNTGWIILPGLSTNAAIVRNIGTGKDAPLCSPYNSTYRWSHDSTKILAINGSEQVVYITDVRAGNCTLVKLPGLDWHTEVLISPDNRKLIIILSGDKQAGTNGRLMTANLDGSGQKKISDLPFSGRESPQVSLVSPDGSAVYVEGYVVDMASGDYAKSPHTAIGWLKEPPPTGIIRNLQVSVEPRQAERGTRFRFNMVGGPIGQEVTWYLSRLPDRQSAILKNTFRVDNNGTLNDNQKKFGFDTDLATEAGDYYIMVFIGDQKIGSGSFTVTEP